MLSEKEITVTCTKCNSRVSIKDMRADSSGKGWVCFGCYNRQHGRSLAVNPVVDKFDAKYMNANRGFSGKTHSSAVEKRAEIKVNGDNASYKCGRCKYQFNGRIITTVARCPYCGHVGSVERVKTAGEIITEVNNNSGWYD